MVKGRTKTQEYTPKPINGVVQPKRREKIVVLSYIVKFYTKKKKEGDPEYVYNPLSIQPTS
ncbi:hypothetical protein, partial [Listeria monocytogenes]|uniref:hypothetical protein n=1 Tax=Listeria monocytogenes TaxID=1639 RepID=UPI002FDC15C2